MKRIVKGRKYDTDTAHEVGSWESTWDARDLHWVGETLYRKRNGEYFLHGEGGAMTQYAVATGQNSWRGGEAIIPLDYENAREWAEDHMEAEGYEAEFGEVGEDGDGETVAATIRIDRATKARLDKLAAKSGKTRGEVVADAIRAVAI